MIANVMNSIKAKLYERNSSPLLGAFVLSWCIWNFRLLMVIFSEATIQDKLSLIENKKTAYIDYFVFDNCASWKILCDIHPYLTQGILLPLISAIAFIFVYPKPAKWIYSYWRTEQKNLREERQKIEDEELLSEEESREVKLDALKAVSIVSEEYEKKIDELNTKIDLLNRENHSHLETIKELNREAQEPTNELVLEKSENNQPTISELEYAILNEISDQPQGCSQDEIVGFIEFHFDGKKDKDEVIYTTERLNQRGLVGSFYTGGESIYEITHEGRGELLKYRRTLKTLDTKPEPKAKVEE